jgi:MATE family multidrug resistance protein
MVKMYSIFYILKLSIPIFFANLAIPLVGIIDTSLMGNLGNLSYLTATSIAANLFSMIFWSFGFLRMGTVGMVSQALGQNNYQEILNIVLSVILVTKFELNIRGVAYGTLFSALITSVIFLIYTFSYLNKFTSIKLNITNLLNLEKMKKIFNINFDIFIRTILLTFSFLWFTYLGSQIGEDYVAANAILINLVFLSAFILDAYAFSTEGMVGYSLGKKDLKLFKIIVKNSFLLSSLTCLFISIIYFFINENVINLMSDIEEIRKLSSSYVVWLILLPFIASFCYQFDGIFIGSSQTKELRNAMIFSVFCYLLISILLTKYLSNTGVWISLCLFMILRGLSLFYYLDKIYKRFNF